MIKRNYLLVIIAFLFLTSCSTKNHQALFNAATDMNTESIKGVYVVNDQGEEDIYYKIKINDMIAIRNLQNKEWGSSQTQTVTTGSVAATGENVTTYRVDIDGSVNLPAIGKVLIAGLSRREATAKLQERYGSVNFLRDPIIELSIVNLKVTLLGEFNKQGNFLLTKDNTTLVEVIGEAGGLSKTADPKTLKIIRGNRENPELIYVDLSDIKSLSSRKLILQNNDIISLQQTKNAVLADRLQKSNNIIQPLLVVINLAVLIFTLTK